MAKHPGRDEASAGSIEVVDYDPEWPALFEAEAERIRAACGRVVVEIEHIGSTSVPGLAAKPIIDIMPGVEDIAGARARLEAGMRGLGYESLGEYGIPGRLYFRKGVPRSHHVHVFEVGKPEWRKHLLFRDYLRAHGEAVEEYAAMKRRLAARHRTAREAYTDAKSPFIQGILELAGWRANES
ncbi:MAG TPA: GrpB family protein [Tepidiformaceae bacterium]